MPRAANQETGPAPGHRHQRNDLPKTRSSQEEAREIDTMEYQSVEDSRPLSIARSRRAVITDIFFTA
jgi:hypothetical protein